MIRLLFICLISNVIFANEVELLTNTKQEIINLSKEQIEQTKQINQYNWLSDITLKASVSKDEDNEQSEDYSISISQDIFKFGGISSKIQYAKELQKLQILNIDINAKTDINSLFLLLLDIKLDEISLKQNMLNLKNSYIDISHKKSQYKEGDIGISDLNDAIINKNEFREIEKELELSKQINISNLKKYTSKKYNIINIPSLKLINKKIFLQESTSIKYASLETKVNNLSYKIKRSDYLPTVSFDTKYGYSDGDKLDSNDYYSYGLSLSVPLSYTSSNDIEQEKLNYFISKQEMNDEIKNITLIYNNSLSTIKSYKEKIQLAVEDIELYRELLALNTEEYNAGYKTIDDVETFKNSKKIRELDIESYKLYIQKELIVLYSHTL